MSLKSGFAIVLVLGQVFPTAFASADEFASQAIVPQLASASLGPTPNESAIHVSQLAPVRRLGDSSPATPTLLVDVDDHAALTQALFGGSELEGRVTIVDIAPQSRSSKLEAVLAIRGDSDGTSYQRKVVIEVLNNGVLRVKIQPSIRGRGQLPMTRLLQLILSWLADQGFAQALFPYRVDEARGAEEFFRQVFPGWSPDASSAYTRTESVPLGGNGPIENRIFVDLKELPFNKKIEQNGTSSPSDSQGPVVFTMENRGRVDEETGARVPTEDRHFAFRRPGGIQVGAVFDGMGGHAYGAEASEAVADFIEARMRKMSYKGDAAQIIKRVNKIILDADKMLKKRKDWVDGRGTTVAITVTRPSSENPAMVENLSFVVGDSRVYAGTPEGELHVLSLDDMPGVYVDGLPEIQAALGPDTQQHFLSHVTQQNQIHDFIQQTYFNTRHMIYNALTPGGGEWEKQPPNPIPQVSRVLLPVGTRVLVATDGLTDTVEDPRLGKIFMAAPKGLGARAVVEAADQDLEANTFRANDDDRTAIEIVTEAAPPSTSAWDGFIQWLAGIRARLPQRSAVKNRSHFSISA